MTVTISYLTISLGMNRHQHDQTAQKTDLSAWSSSLTSWSFLFLALGIILLRAFCLSWGVGSSADTMSSMSSIIESQADGIVVWKDTHILKSAAAAAATSSTAYLAMLSLECCLQNPQFNYPASVIIVLFVWILIKKKVVKGKGMRGIQDLVIK